MSASQTVRSFDRCAVNPVAPEWERSCREPVRNPTGGEQTERPECRSLLLTFVIPTKDRPEHLGRALRSVGVLDEAAEIIVVDDGSKPESGRRNRNLCARFPGCRYESLHEPRGASAARNVGLKVSGGRFVWFLDDDDYLTPGAVRDVLRAAAMGYDDHVLLLPRLVVRQGIPIRLDVPVDEHNKWDRYRRTGIEVTTSCAVFPRRVLLQLHGWDESLPALQDTDLLLRAAGIASFTLLRTEPVRVDVGAPARITNSFARSQVGKLKFLRKHWRILPRSRRLRYLVQIIGCSPLFRSLRQRRRYDQPLLRFEIVEGSERR